MNQNYRHKSGLKLASLYKYVGDNKKQRAREPNLYTRKMNKVIPIIRIA